MFLEIDAGEALQDRSQIRRSARCCAARGENSSTAGLFAPFDCSVHGLGALTVAKAESRAISLRYTEISIQMKQRIRSTTVLCVRREGKVVMAGDGQVTLGSEVLKSTARKLRRLYNDKILAGFAGSTADALSLTLRFEAKLEQFNGNLPRAVVELAKEWRTDKILRHLEALLLVADAKNTYIVSGNGDVIEPDESVASIGSGGPFALAAATALVRHTKLSARQIAEEAMKIAADTCIYTNNNIIYEELA
jgi:ATP-dependent HslUV protease subunit HslV